MIPALIGAASSLLGGWLSKSSADASRDQQSRQFDQQLAMQREFAQQGIRWKVADAKAAGIHPLFALGAQTHSFTPQSIGSTADSSMGDAVASAGQNLGRAAQAAMSFEEREKSKIADALTLEKAGLENDLLRTQIHSLKAKQLGPAAPGGPLGPLTSQSQGDARKYNLASDIPIHARPSETPAEKLEDEYGDESIINFINNNWRQFRDLIETGRVGNMSLYGGKPYIYSGKPIDLHTPRGRDWSYRRSRPSRW